MRPYPPLGLLYISAYLERHQIKHEVFDSTFSNKVSIKKRLLGSVPKVIALYTNLVTKVNVVEIMQFIRANKVFENSWIVLGGPDVRYNAENYLKHGADVLVVGEGEATMLELAQTMLAIDKPNFAHIDGVAYLNEQGEVVETNPRKRIRPIDSLPYPNRAAINIKAYLGVWKLYHGHSAMTVSTQRGCPYTCRWCSTAVYGQSYRRRSPSIVVDELVHIKENFNPNTIWFVDDVFTVSHNWLKAFAEEINARDAIIPFECITRADRMNEEVIQLLKKAGCFRVWIGSESGSQKIIDAMDRRVDVQHVRNMIRRSREEGLQAGTFIMLGYPGETEADIEETITHLKESNPDQFTITVAYPIKGTGLYEEIEDIRTTSPDWGMSTDRDIDFKRTYPKSYYKYAVNRVVNEVHLYKKQLNKELWTVEGMKMWAKVSGAKLGMWWHRRGVETREG